MTTATITWLPDPVENGVTQYNIEKSTNSAISWVSVLTVPYDLSGPNYDRVQKLFFYTDTSANPGDIFRVSAAGIFGTSDFAYTIVPPAVPPMCHIIGYTRTVFNEVNPYVKINVAAYAGKSSWMAMPGAVGQTKAPLGIISWESTVFPDSTTGIWKVDLVQGCYAMISIPEQNFEIAFQVPMIRGPINIQDIQPIPSADFYSVTGKPRGVPIDILPQGS